MAFTCQNEERQLSNDVDLSHQNLTKIEIFPDFFLENGIWGDFLMKILFGMLGGVHCWLPLLHLLLEYWDVAKSIVNHSIDDVSRAWLVYAAFSPLYHVHTFALLLLLLLCWDLSLMVLSNDRKQEKAFYCFHSRAEKSHIQNYKKSLRETPTLSVCCRFPSSPFYVVVLLLWKQLWELQSLEKLQN